MIGFHFPPSALSSGHLRLLAFAKYLPAFSWTPLILSAKEGAYEAVDRSSVSAIPPGVHVHRAFALDTRRHLGIHGRYPSLLAQPDRWASWWPAAVSSGLRLIRRHRVRVIWSTFPIMTAHCVAHTLNRLTGIPWVADFRDPVAMAVIGKNQRTVRNQTRWEQRVLSRAACTVFTTPGAMQACSVRYPSISGEGRIAVIPNGYDEDDFSSLPHPEMPAKSAPLHFVHAGVLYPGGRNPSSFFQALANMKSARMLNPGDIRITLRASGADDRYRAELERLGIADVVTLAPFLSYREALAEQASADGLLLFQGEQFDQQIPAKLYEYVRIGKPIFALVGERGDTAALLSRIPVAVKTPIDDSVRIQQRLIGFIEDVREGRFARMAATDVAQYSRRDTVRQFADLLDKVSGNRTEY